MKFNVNRFHHHSDIKSFTAEASDIPEYRGQYTGNKDGLTLVSDLGNEAQFYVTKVVRSNDEDQELLYWEYLPTAESIERNPRLKDYTLTVFND